MRNKSNIQSNRKLGWSRYQPNTCTVLYENATGIDEMKFSVLSWNLGQLKKKGFIVAFSKQSYLFKKK